MVDILVVLLCASCVVLTGFVVWCLYLSGRRLNSVVVCEALLGASLAFGTLAIVWLHTRGVLALALGGRAEIGQPGNEIWVAIGHHIPQKLAYAAPLILMGMMVGIGWLPLRSRLFAGHSHIQRGTPH